MFQIYYILSRPLIVLIGGIQDSRRCDIFNPFTKKFNKCCGLSLKRTDDFDCIVHNGLVFAISSSEYSSIGTVETYNIISNTWQSFCSLPQPIVSLAAVSHGQNLFVLGGFNRKSFVKSKLVYELDYPVSNLNDIDYKNAQSWIESNHSLFIERSHHSAISFNDRIWIVGGIIGSENTSTNSVEIYDSKTQNSSIGPFMIRNRFQPRLVVINNDLYVVGGDMIGTKSILGSIEKYDKTNKKFVFVTNFVKKRLKMSCCGHSNKIYVFGGSDGSDVFNDWEAFNVIDGEWEISNSNIISGRPKGMKSAIAVCCDFNS